MSHSIDSAVPPAAMAWADWRCDVAGDDLGVGRCLVAAWRLLRDVAFTFTWTLILVYLGRYLRKKSNAAPPHRQCRLFPITGFGFLLLPGFARVQPATQSSIVLVGSIDGLQTTKR